MKINIKCLSISLFWLLSYLFSCPIYAQSYIESQQQLFDSYVNKQKNRFDNYVNEQTRKFNEMRDKLNEQFIDYLSSHWLEKSKDKDYTDGLVIPDQPDPVVPVFPEENKEVVAPKENVEESVPIVVFPIDDEIIIIEEDIIIPDEHITIDNTTIEVDILPSFTNISYLGHNFKVRLPKSKNRMDSFSEENIAKLWKSFSDDDGYDLLTSDCQKIKSKNKLCDWAYYQFVTRVSEEFYGQDCNESVLLSAYILAQSRFDFRFAHDGVSLVPMLPFNSSLYEWGFVILNGKYYYPTKNLPDRFYVLEQPFSELSLPFDTSIREAMKITSNNIEKRRVKYSNYSEYSFELPFNKNLVDFFATYPKTDVCIHAKTPLDEMTRTALFSYLTEAIKGKSELDKVNIILQFVQAFTYGYDDDIWGEERYFYPNETLYYPYSDCEDRAILFSYLIRELTDNDVVLLEYPNHLSSAVKFSTDIPGDAVYVNGVKYMVCDPTGYDSAGNAYPQFKKVNAKVYVIQ